MKTALLAYVPVVHKGYVDFFNNQMGDIWIMGQDLIDKYTHLTRDLRDIGPDRACKSLKAILPKRRIRVAHSKDLVSWKYANVIMPEDEVCQDLASKYFDKKIVRFIPVFLRWNKVITFKENEVPAHRKISKEIFHKKMIDLAFVETKKSDDWWRQIACVVLKGGKIISKAHNHHLPTSYHLSINGDPRSNFDAGQHQDIFTSIHSEAEAIAVSARKGISLKGATIYVTTFPCPNCARLIGTAGIKHVYYSKGYSLLDAEKILDHFGVEVVLVE